MSRIETALHAHHANLQQGQGQGTQPQPQNNAAQGLEGPPFAKVNSVVQGSPADQAGLKAGDSIKTFGSVNWINHEKLSKVAEAVQRNEGVRNSIPTLESMALTCL